MYQWWTCLVDMEPSVNDNPGDKEASRTGEKPFLGQLPGSPVLCFINALNNWSKSQFLRWSMVMNERTPELLWSKHRQCQRRCRQRGQDQGNPSVEEDPTKDPEGCQGSWEIPIKNRKNVIWNFRRVKPISMTMWSNLWMAPGDPSRWHQGTPPYRSTPTGARTPWWSNC